MSKETISTDLPELKTLLVGIQAPYNKMRPINTYYDEFLSLINSINLKYTNIYFTKLRNIDKTNFFTKGKLQELKKICEENEIEEIVLSERLTTLQERNLSNYLDCRIWDRDKLILEIFRYAAHSAEGKIQVEMAEIEFMKSQLSGKGVELAQQEGIVGSKGPGETSKEILKRYLAEKYKKAQSRLNSLQKTRDIQRKRRLESKIPLISLVGYTNAGKSSLLNTLTKSKVTVEDKLFATLDITTRELFINHKKIGLISDTVGFISNLPPRLIKAFKSTLDELKYANILLHVIDISNPSWENQIRVVEKTLDELNVEKNIIFVFNKIDKLTTNELLKIKEKTKKYRSKVFIHTKDKSGLRELINLLEKQTL